MYGNLSRALDDKNIAQRVVASLIGCSERTVTNKINGTTDFTISEAFMIHRNLLPEFNVDYLFKTTDDQAS